MNRTQLPLRQPLSGIWPTTVDFAEGTPVKNAQAEKALKKVVFVECMIVKETTQVAKGWQN